eukprot:scaffold77517_cov56-Cyclotella_meneghiniana.AAC.2
MRAAARQMKIKSQLIEAQANVCEAWKAKRLIEIDDGERRAAWLDEILTQRALEVGGDPAKAIKCMINAAKRKGMFKRLRAILKSAWSSLDYIEVPNEKWLLDEESNELYEFDNGIFVAHAKFEENLYEQYGQIKIPPNTAKVVEVEISGEAIYVKNPESIQQATWSRVTKPEEMEQWLLKRNKRHLQQMYIENCPPTMSNFAPILEEYGTSSKAKQVLNGECDLESLNLSPEMKWFLESLKMNENEKKLDIPKRMTREDFQK